ncbi:MAG: bifunctional 3,4-dihydroxy-2-butanone-4-phosphate synthase/GTP cyclohydrolase II [Verrucomicrobiales bacterium]|nr:bifunctional 3,4-dihydroxy-2-butanone-4-phosphate synthase/GTP cyclohydrolase II [Verrucomicrobiales bacterium]
MNNNPPFSPIEDIITDIKAGKMVIITDDADRENEGDLIASAECITPEIVNFMAKYGRGLICTPISESIATRLELPMMVPNNRESFKTNFTVSVDAAKGITTGISAADRATTIKLLSEDCTIGEDLVQPGHIFPLLAKPGGVLRRAGHTEAAIDLAKLAGLNEAAVICEILNDDGTMSRLPELLNLANEHDLKIGTIESLIQYRRKRERLIEHLETISLPTSWGDFDLHMYQSAFDEETHLALVRGKIDPDSPITVRVHSECLTGDVFGSKRCDCGIQLDSAMERISSEENGILLYMRQEGRGIGLKAKIHAYKLQEEGYDTVEANEKLGYPSDLRDYGIGAQILYDLGVRKIRLMTNNPKKVVGLNAHKLEIVEQIPIKSPPNPHNERYLDTKRDKLGHKL